MPEQVAVTILYVDDEDATRQLHALLFRQEGFDVREAASGGEALRLAAEQKPDLVILDVNLPDINGIEVCRRIKTHPATAFIPVLHISASFVQPSDKVHGLEAGADGYLTKPVEPKELIAHARALLRVHQAEEKARAAVRQWQATFDAISDGVALLDRDGRVVRCNQALARLLGQPADGILGQACEDLTPAAGAGEVSPFRRLLTSHRREAAEVAWNERWLQIHVDPLLEGDDTFAGAVYILADITEHRRLEEKLRQAQKMEAVGRLAGGVAHDFNNLLGVITGNAGLLLAELPKGKPGSEMLEAIDRAAWRAAELVRQLLGFSRQALLWLKPVNINQAVDEVVALLRRTIDPRITVEVQCVSDLWAVQADPGQVNQVLMNLCLNARDAMPEGGRLHLDTANVVLSDDAGRLHLEARPGEFVRLRVSDTGHGIAPEVRGRIFEPFFTTKDVGKGTGLGLALVFGIVQQHRGWVECFSEVNHGTRFDVYLPRSLTVTPGQAGSAVPPQPIGGRETILLVDDEPMLRTLGRTILQRYGYQVLIAEDGQRATEIYEREQSHIDLVILDLMMPQMSGRDALRRLRQINPAVPVLLASGYSVEQTVGSGEGAVQGFIQKPYVVQDLARTVRAALDRLHGERA